MLIRVDEGHAVYYGEVSPEPSLLSCVLRTLLRLVTAILGKIDKMNELNDGRRIHRGRKERCTKRTMLFVRACVKERRRK